MRNLIRSHVADRLVCDTLDNIDFWAVILDLVATEQIEILHVEFDLRLSLCMIPTGLEGDDRLVPGAVMALQPDVQRQRRFDSLLGEETAWSVEDMLDVGIVR